MTEPELHHGGAIHRMRALFADAPEPWIDLSTGINPWPYPVEAARLAHFARLPDQDLFAACRASMAQAFGAPQSAVLPAPGSEALIMLLPRLINVRTVALADPTYADHAAVWRAFGAEVVAIGEPLEAAGAVDAIVVVNPNNPDGRRISAEALRAAHHAQLAHGGWLIIDEAFVELEPALSLAAHTGAPGLIVLRSFGKFYGLAGLRLGALLGPGDLLSAAQNALGSWAVNGPALAIGAAAYADQAWQEKTRARLSAARAQLDAILAPVGLAPKGGADLFRFVETPEALAVWRHLGRAGIAVRRFAWSDRFLRIGLPASDAERVRLASALQDER